MRPEFWLSPSAIKVYQACPRKYWWRYTKKVKEPQRSAQTLGVDVHKHNERYITDGVFPPTDRAGRVARAGIQLLPPPGTLAVAEPEIRFVEDGIGYLGYVDLVYEADARTLVIVDYKTTKNLRYALTPEQLRTDVQAITYAYAAMRDGQYDAVDLRWIYYPTEGTALPQVTEARLTRAFVADEWQKVRTTAHGMIELRRQVDASHEAIEPDLDACSAYGGCFYKDRCFAAKQRSSSMSVSLLEMLRKASTQTAAHETPYKAPVQPAPVAPPPSPTQVMRADLSIPGVVIQSGPAAAIAAIVPPDAPAPVVSLPAAAEPKKRGRAAKVAQVTTALVPAETVIASMAGSMNAVVQASAPTGFTLYVNCLPVGGNVTRVGRVMQQIVTELEAELGAPVRLSEEGQYGKADSLILMALKNSSALVEFSDAVFVDSRDPDCRAVLAYLESIAGTVVRSVI